MEIPGLKFLHFGERVNRGKLWDILNKNTSKMARGSFAPYRLLHYLSANCVTAILEEEYIDRDFADAYGKLYARGYQIHKRFCSRLHFFSEQVAPEAFYDPAKENKMQEAYLGYTVILPSLPQTLGRTVLKPRQDNKDFILVKDEFPANLLGFRLKVEGTPFIEQDRRVSACATAAIWMATTAIGKRYGIPYYSTTDITELASRKVVGMGRAIPSEGLTIQQMLDALQSMGYDTVCFDDIDAQKAKDIVYKHVESQLPVILGIEFLQGRHALTVIGHSYDKDIMATKEPNPDWGDFNSSWQPYTTSHWVPNFIVNCDQRGCYQKLRFLEKQEIPKRFMQGFDGKEPVRCGVELMLTPDGRIKQERLAALRAIILILPRQVFLTGTQAETKSYGLILRAHKEIYGKPPPQDIVLRTYLISSNNFKASLSDTTMRTITPCENIISAYRFKRFSRNVWVTEIGRLDKRKGKECKDLLIEGEIVLDASSSARSSEFICLHLKGKFIYMEPDEVDFKLAIDRLRDNGQIKDNLIDDYDYSPLCRFS